MKLFTLACLAALSYADGDASYNYMNQGQDWGSVNQLCRTGRRQSPIDLPEIGEDGLKGDYHLHVSGKDYTNYSQQIVNYGDHTIKVTAGQGNYHLVSQDDLTYPFTLAQFHMHAPSEHTRGEKHYDLEMHFVHLINQNSVLYDALDSSDITDSADYAVIGIFFDREAGGNETNSFIEQFQISSDISTTGDVSVNQFDVSDFLNSANFDGFYHYDGSFTTPPCTEGVKWVLLNEVQSISDAQLKLFTDRWADNYDFALGNGNNRFVQQVNERTLYYSGAVVLVNSALVALSLTTIF